MTRAAAIVAVLATTGCLPKMPFVPVREPGLHVGPRSAYEVTLPVGWMRVNEDEPLALTREGPTLQRIIIVRRDVKKPLPQSKRKLEAGMEPYELAELLAGEITSSQGITGVKILENAPANVGGARGFKLVVAYKDQDGLRMKSVMYGALTQGWLWSLHYTAPVRVYFDRDLPTFQRVVTSFRFKATSS